LPIRLTQTPTRTSVSDGRGLIALAIRPAARDVII